MTPKKGILYSSGQLDCLSYYRKIFPKLKGFLGNREIATKIYLKGNIPYIIKRGSKDEPLFIDELKISDKFLELRKAQDLEDVRDKLKKIEEKIWHYFVPRKITEMHYACNHEKGEIIDRIFIDIDRGKAYSAEDSRKVVLELLKCIKEDKELKKKVKFKTLILWTGKSFHVYLLLNKKFPVSFYNNFFSWNKNGATFTEKYAMRISEKTGINVEAHHEKKENKIILDTSATPPGKLARCPFSLHVSIKGEIDGVSVPLKEKELKRKNIVNELLSLTPDKIIKNISKYSI
jgi:hypothetical protein